ncbi:hypothetical protein VDBG_03762 [Verticillium alfalfae VaMs.102]|uniref:Uncharacterized protein n=1 Tax=Verticillium alfalfae (strain VaMs.102 / ATCC MYA-4576 / FGSC 10136) TaxID=526221 RepID=C9SH59_VERA1|nr:hypothetical protein VDBG_03762 [Verticillium alfalfae VaMs.102]EEY17653.1 hypothetical protein VDBG_03762 [Verticillium alfalfae VaMs.102]
MSVSSPDFGGSPLALHQHVFGELRSLGSVLQLPATELHPKASRQQYESHEPQ